MSHLILPPHAKGKSELEQQVQEARNTLILGFTFLLPGDTQPLQMNLNMPCSIEAVALAVVQVAVEQIRQKKARELAEKLVPANGIVN